MEEPVEDGGGDAAVVVEDRRPLLVGLVRGQDDGAALVALADDLEEEIGAYLVEGQVWSSTTASIRSDRPFSIRSCTKSRLQRSFGAAGAVGRSWPRSTRCLRRVRFFTWRPVYCTFSRADCPRFRCSVG